MKKFLSIILAIVLILSCTILFTGCDALTQKNDADPPATEDVLQQNDKNVILFIGDGMGSNHVANAITYFELDAPAFTSDRKVSSKTDSLSGTTDSAAGATALATGQKTNNNVVGKNAEGQDLTNISELAKQAGKKVGIVTTDNLFGATPSGFSAHANKRSESQVIMKSQAKSDIDLFIGLTDDTDAYVYESSFTNNGYVIASFYEDLLAKKDSEKLLATLPKMKSEYGAGANGHVQLDDLVSFAIDFLENENGFFLMVEGAYIDKYSHSNDIVNALAETRSLFDAIAVGYAYVEENSSTTVIVTADHETGGLKLATTKSEVQNSLYVSENHTSTSVPVYVKNFEYFTDKPAIPNTEVFTICKSALGIN